MQDNANAIQETLILNLLPPTFSELPIKEVVAVCLGACQTCKIHSFLCKMKKSNSLSKGKHKATCRCLIEKT